MRVFRAGNLDDIYRDLVAELLAEAFHDESRLGQASDLGPTTLVIEPGTLKLVANAGRAINPRLAFVEACWILSGERLVAPLATITPRFRRFSDDGHTLSGAYGYRLRRQHGFDQLELAIRTFRADPTSRRSFALIAEPSDAGSSSRDVPCNIAIMFRIRANRLHMTVVNRSNDVIFGVPYDIFSFSLIHAYLTRALGIAMGDHTHIANSMHLYKANRDIAERVARGASTIALPSGHSADAFMSDLMDEHQAIGHMNVRAIRNPRLRRLFGQASQAPLATQHDAVDWLEAMTAQWSSRPRSSMVAAETSV